MNRQHLQTRLIWDGQWRWWCSDCLTCICVTDDTSCAGACVYRWQMLMMMMMLATMLPALVGLTGWQLQIDVMNINVIYDDT